MNAFEILQTIAVLAVSVSILCLLLAGVFRNHPANRSWVLAIGFVALVSLPMLVVVSDRLGFGLAPSSALGEPISAPSSLPLTDVQLSTANDSQESLGAAPAVSPIRTASDGTKQAFDWSLVLYAFWATGCIVGLVLLGRAVLQVVRLRRTARPSRSTATLACLDVARQKVGAHAKPELLDSSAVSIPLALGGFRPAIVLPDKMPALESEALEGVLCHELAHLKHRHHLVSVVQALGRSMFWWNPLVHMMDRQLDAAKEELCDNYALRQSKRRKPYAEALVTFGEMAISTSRYQMSTSFVRSGSELEARIRRVLSSKVTTMTGVSRFGLVAGSVAIMGSTTFALYSVPSAPSVGSNLWPIREASEWIYQERREARDQKRAPETYQVRRLFWTTYKAEDGKPIYEMRDYRRGKISSTFWGIGEDGVRRYPFAMGAPFKLDPKASQPVVKSSAKAGAQWTGVSEAGYQTLSTIPPSTVTDKSVRYSTTVAGVNELIKVPAGQFRTIKVVERSTVGKESQVRTIWFAPGTGIVKEQESWRDGGFVIDRELERHDKGTDSTDPAKQALKLAGLTPADYKEQKKTRNRIATVKMELLKLQQIGKRESAEFKTLEKELVKLERTPKLLLTVEEPLVTGSVRSKFFSLGGGEKLIRVYKGKASFFNPLQPQHWQSLMTEEGFSKGKSVDYRMSLAHAGVALSAKKLGIFSPTPLVGGGGGIGEGSGITRATTDLNGLTSDGRSWSLMYTMNFAEGRISKVEYKLNYLKSR